MMLKVFDLLRSLGWYIVTFIYNLIDAIIKIIKKLNAFDIINVLSDNQAFKKFYTGIMAIAVTLLALFIIWKIINKLLDPDDETTFKSIFMEIFKCGVLVMMSTFLFVQVSKFSITLANYTGNIFENSTNLRLSDTMLSMFITYNEDYLDSKEYNEEYSISKLISDDKFNDEELYLAKYVTKAKLIFADEQDYKYAINWIMAIFCGGFFLYSLIFSGITLGKRQVEFLFLFTISPIVFATSICNKQRRGAVIEQLVSLALQSAIVMLIVSLSVMILQQVNMTEFFGNKYMDTTTKALLYLGCATFVLNGSQAINRFIGANVSANSGREQLMSLMGYGKLAGAGAGIATGAAIGGGLLATGVGMKVGKRFGSKALTQAGATIGSFGIPNSSNEEATPMQKFANAMGTKMYMAGQKMSTKKDNRNRFSPSDAFINVGANTLNGTIKKVMPRASYNSSYYRRKKRMEV